MGITTMNGLLWSDSTQDIVDNYLDTLKIDGKKYDYEKNYTKKELDTLFQKASKSKKLLSDFNKEWVNNVRKKKPTRKQFLNHIKIGLFMK